MTGVTLLEVGSLNATTLPNNLLLHMDNIDPDLDGHIGAFFALEILCCVMRIALMAQIVCLKVTLITNLPELI